MRLGVVGSDDNTGLGASYVRAATALGHDATLIAADELVAGSRRMILSRRLYAEKLVSQPLLWRLRDRLTQIDPDLIIIVKGRFIPRRWIEELRASFSWPIVNYYPDHPLWPGHSDPQLGEALFAYDEVLTWSADVAQSLQGHGLACVRVIPFGYDPALYSEPPSPIERQWDISLIGQFYPDRLRFLLAVADHNVLVSGRGWIRGASQTSLANRVQDRRYAGEDVCRVYWQSTAAFNIVAPWNVRSHNMRTFEIPAARTAMIATRTPEHEALFGEDGAVLIDSPEEGREALLAFMSDPELQRAIADEGCRRVKGHTYAERMASLLAKWTREAR